MLSIRKHPHLYEINTLVWLEQLSAQHGRELKLADVPDEEWQRLKTKSFDLVYLLGVWKRSLIGRDIFRADQKEFASYQAALPNWNIDDVVGSPFSIQDYVPDPRIGDWTAIDSTRQRLHSLGMGLILDFVPNHTGFDHPWVPQFPERYILGSLEDFHRSPNAFFQIKDASGTNRFVARGKDPFFPPWNDVAQLNYFNPDCRAAMIRVLQTIAQHCDGVRCDMAMLVTNEVFSRTWANFLQNWPWPAAELWSEARGAVPDLLWIGEVYWDMEWTIQQFGFQFTYDKRLYDRLRAGVVSELRGHLTAGIAYQNKLMRFLENHDEPRGAAVFSREQLQSLALLLSTLPGMRFYYQGQLEGRRIRPPMPLVRVQHESDDPEVRGIYDLVLPLANADVFHRGEWELLAVESAGDPSNLALIAYSWTLENVIRVIVVNLSPAAAQGKVRLTQGLPESSHLIFSDALTGKDFTWDRTEVGSQGLYVRLDANRAHCFSIHPT